MKDMNYNEITRREFMKYATALLLTGCATVPTGTQTPTQEAAPRSREFEPRILVEDFD